MRSDRLVFSDAVRGAMQRGDEVVALESTIISHGMPFPQNLEVAKKLEAILSAQPGVVPATIAILKGKIHIGLNEPDLLHLAKAGMQMRKVSRRDVADVLAKGESGATTVATTMMFAGMAGLRLFVTGGIGGVHRGDSWDVSADLEEFSISRVAVVCAGAKSILDLPKTLEVLETKGVPVVGYKTKTFPSFFTRGDSAGNKRTQPLDLVSSVDTPAEAAALIETQTNGNSDHGLHGGLVLCNPIPAESECHEAEDAIQIAVREAEKQKVVGKNITPFLLKRVNELTKGKSLKANIALVENNARLGAEVAAELRALRKRTQSQRCSASSSSSATCTSFAARAAGAATPLLKTQPQEPSGAVKIQVVGGATLDYVCRPSASLSKQDSKRLHTSLPGSVRTTPGGVGRNIAEAVCRLLPFGATLHTAIGDDAAATAIVEDCRAKKIGFVSCRPPAGVGRGTKRSTSRTAQYVAVLDGAGDLVSAIADMEVLDAIEAETFSEAEVCIVDGNVGEVAIGKLVESVGGSSGSSVQIRSTPSIWFEPVSTVKSLRLFALKDHCDLLTPNLDELAALVTEGRRRKGKPPADSLALNTNSNSSSLTFSPDIALRLLHAFRDDVSSTATVVLTCGADGCVVFEQSQRFPTTSVNSRAQATKPAQQLQVKELAANVTWLKLPPCANVVNCTGAGDTLMGVLAWAVFHRRLCLLDAVVLGMLGACLTLQSDLAVSDELAVGTLEKLLLDGGSIKNPIEEARPLSRL